MEQSRPRIADHCRALGIVGESLVAQLGTQVEGQLLKAAHAGRPLFVSGPAGSGRTLAARLCHRVAAATYGRPGSLFSVDCSGSDDLLQGGLDGQGLRALAGRGTLVLDGVERLPARSQAVLAGLLERQAHAAAGDAEAPFVVVVGRDERPAGCGPSLLAPQLAAALPSPVQLPPLFARGPEIQQLAAHFLREVAAETCPGRSLLFTRRSLSDLRQSVEGRRIASVGRLREVVRDTVLSLLARGELPDRIHSDLLAPLLDGASPAQSLAQRQAERDLEDLDAGLAGLIDQALLLELARRHRVPQQTLESFCRIMESLLGDEQEGARLSYPQVVERARVVSRVALWLVSGARCQSDFRKFFGHESWQMPTKSVAWAIFHDVVGDDAAGDGEHGEGER